VCGRGREKKGGGGREGGNVMPNPSSVSTRVCADFAQIPRGGERGEREKEGEFPTREEKKNRKKKTGRRRKEDDMVIPSFLVFHFQDYVLRRKKERRKNSEEKEGGEREREDGRPQCTFPRNCGYFRPPKRVNEARGKEDLRGKRKKRRKKDPQPAPDLTLWRLVEKKRILEKRGERERKTKGSGWHLPILH